MASKLDSETLLHFGELDAAAGAGELDAAAGELLMPLFCPLGHPFGGLGFPSATSSRNARIATTPLSMGSGFQLFIDMYF